MLHLSSRVDVWEKVEEICNKSCQRQGISHMTNLIG